MNIFFLGIIILFLNNMVTFFTSQKYKSIVTSILTGLSSFLCCTPAISSIFNNHTISQSFNFNPIYGEINFEINQISAFFIIIISIMSLLAVIYANGYLEPYRQKGKNLNAHLTFLSTLIASMYLVVTAQNALMFLICWEIMSLSSFFLVIFENEIKSTIKAGIKYLIFMHISVLFIIIAFALCAINAGSFNFADFNTTLIENSNLANIVFLLAFVGFGTKAGFVPFHNWLPDAHPAAPSHVSAIMSGVMIKMGIYGIIKMCLLTGTPSKLIAYTVLTVSLFTALYGVLYTVTQLDIKRLLAYCSIENIGIIGLGLGIGLIGQAYQNSIVTILGYAGAFLHILNHSIFKELLFLAAGCVYLKTHTRDMEILGGLIKKLPITAILFLIGAVSICGLPPFNGFISEFLIYYGTLKGLSINNFFSATTLIFALSGLAFVGTIAILAFTKVFSITFLGQARSEQAKAPCSEVTKTMLIPMGIMACFTLLIGLFPQHLFNFICIPINTFIDTSILQPTTINILSQISQFIFIFIITIILLITLRFKLSKKVEHHETWGCGYDNPNAHMQYSASSYTSPFLAMLKPLFKKIFDIQRPKKLFPKNAHFSLHIDDIEEAYLINPIIKYDEMFLSKFEKIQSGNIQDYIKYGLFFLILLIIGCFFIG